MQDMAAPSTILTRQGDLIPVSNINKVSLSGVTISFAHSDGETTVYSYQDADSALADFNNIGALLEAAAVGDPEIYISTPGAILQASLPQALAITGVAFDSTAVVFAANYAGSYDLTAVFGSSTGLAGTAPALMNLGTYDFIYSDANGKKAVLPNALVIY